VQADALFILGDLFEYWVGDDMLGLPFEARCAQALRRHAAPAHPVLRGNRDFLLGERFFAETGCRIWPIRRCCGPAGATRCW
jgi:UDP-2,3-diacylglucosamine hydrolase